MHSICSYPIWWHITWCRQYIPHHISYSSWDCFFLYFILFFVDQRSITCLDRQNWIDSSWCRITQMHISGCQFYHRNFSCSQCQRISIISCLWQWFHSNFPQKWQSYILSSYGLYHLCSRDISTICQSIFQRHYSQKFSIRIIWPHSSYTKWYIIDRSVFRQRQCHKS